MTRGRKWVVTGSFLACLAIAAFFLAAFVLSRPPSEPAYGGKGLTWWVSRFNHGPDEYRQASAALQAMGEKSIPRLLALLRGPEEPWQNRWIRFLNRQPFFKFSLRPRGPFHDQVAAAFVALGEKGRAGWGELEKMATGEPDGIYAFEILSLAAGADAIPALARGVQSNEPLIRSNAVISLRNLSPVASRAAPLLVRGAIDPDPGVRGRALGSMEEMARRSREQYIDGLIGALSNADLQVAIRAVEELSHLESRRAIPILTQLSAGTNGPLKEASAAALRTLESRRDTR